MKLNLFDISFNEFLAWTCFSIKFDNLKKIQLYLAKYSRKANCVQFDGKNHKLLFFYFSGPLDH